MATSPSNLLPFAAAMALDPSDVEVCLCPEGGDSPWLPLDKQKYLTLYQLRMRYFRRARPRRSRVQEMAERDWGGPHVDSSEALAARAMTHAIRAVCEYLRTHPSTHAVTDIEREFLEER